MIHHMQATASHTWSFKAKFLERKLHEACTRYGLDVPSVEGWDTKGLVPKTKPLPNQQPLVRPALRQPTARASQAASVLASQLPEGSDTDSDSEEPWDPEALHSMAEVLAGSGADD